MRSAWGPITFRRRDHAAPLVCCCNCARSGVWRKKKFRENSNKRRVRSADRRRHLDFNQLRSLEKARIVLQMRRNSETRSLDAPAVDVDAPVVLLDRAQVDASGVCLVNSSNRYTGCCDRPAGLPPPSAARAVRRSLAQGGDFLDLGVELSVSRR